MNFYKYIFILMSYAAVNSNCSAKIAEPETKAFVKSAIEVRNAGELQALKPQPGDTIYFVGKEWQNSTLTLKGTGTAQKPIIYKVRDPQGTFFSKNSNLTIDGQWIVADGFIFKDGSSLKNDVIIFSKKSAHCTLINSAVIDYNPINKEQGYKWVSLFGTHNTVTHCELTGKTNSGTTLVVWLDEKPNHHTISNNYFGPRPELGQNGGETIRIGTSTWSMYTSKTTVRNNIFDACDGEAEIISIKSCFNTIEENLFYECSGTLTFRHGNDNIVCKNFFIGNDKNNTGGIRVIGERQLVENNYLYKLKGKSLRSALSIMNALQNPQLHEYFQVKNATIRGNTIVACAEGIIVGSGANTTRVMPPINCSIQDNICQDLVTTIKYEAHPIDLKIKNNKSTPAIKENGFVKMDKALKQNKNGLYTEVSPFWLDSKTTIGTSWKKLRSFPIH